MPYTLYLISYTLYLTPNPFSLFFYKINISLKKIFSCVPSLRLSLASIQFIYTEDTALLQEINTFNIFLSNANKPSLKIKKSDTAAIKLVWNETMKDEAYKIELVGKNIHISGKKNGVFYGLMTLFQWMTQSVDKQNFVLRNDIYDFPAFTWRGMHLDVSRHFFPTGFIKKYIDILAMHKMNTFHWHLTDDQGWRIEIKKYPLLTGVGSKRKETMVDKHFDPYLGDRTPVEGYYTQDQIADIVKYAALRHITVVPEIEMPGHAQAALAAYPEFSCNKQASEVLTKWGVSEQVFCSDDQTIAFLKDILDEVMALFPSTYIHIGGDEVPKASWKACAVCQQKMKQQRLKNENELQSYFIRQIDDYVTSKGRRIIGWDEILEGGLAENAAVMSWRGEEGGISAAKQKHHVVMSPGSHCYFDHYQSKSSDEPLAIGGFTPIEKVYSYNPLPATLSDNEKEYILGAQGNVWTEYMQISSQVEYMAVPRLCALSEVLWSGDRKPGFDNFKTRLRTHFKTLDRYQILYAKTIFDITAEINTVGGKTTVALKNHFKQGQIHYTTDGNPPNTMSAIYNEKNPLVFTQHTQLKAQYFENGKALGAVFTTEILTK
jgi:hexosaminidase